MSEENKIDDDKLLNVLLEITIDMKVQQRLAAVTSDWQRRADRMVDNKLIELEGRIHKDIETFHSKYGEQQANLEKERKASNQNNLKHMRVVEEYLAGFNKILEKRLSHEDIV